MARRKTEQFVTTIRPITKLALRRMADDRDQSMTETMEQIVLARARDERPELFHTGGSEGEPPAGNQEGSSPSGRSHS